MCGDIVTMSSKTNTIPGHATTLVLKGGYLEKRQRGRANPDSTFKKKFQKRYVVLTCNGILYYEKESVSELAKR